MALTQINPALFAGSSNTTAVIQSNGTTAVTVDSSQNVGIGTSSPLRKFHVKGSGNTSQFESTSSSGYVYIGDSTSSSIDNQGIGSVGNNLSVLVGGSERMRINSSGYVTMPYQPAFYATTTSSGTVSGSTVIPFNSTVVNIGSCFNTSTYRFTAPVAGTYMFIAQPSFNNAAAARVSIRKNGSYYFEYEGETTTSSWLTTTFGSLITMAVNDYVDVYNGNGSLAYDSPRWMGFYGYLIG